jgi:hypothetical protein
MPAKACRKLETDTTPSTITGQPRNVIQYAQDSQADKDMIARWIKLADQALGNRKAA